MADALAAAQADNNRLLGEIEVQKGKVDALQAALDKVPQGGYNDPSINDLKEELENMRLNLAAFVGCLAILPLSVCDVVAATPAPKPRPPLVAEAPPAVSEDMWEKYPNFFARYKTIWLECPVELHVKESIEAAKWYNDHTAQYDTMLKTCRDDKKSKPQRAWPPTEQGAKMREVHFFSWKCAGGQCQWVQTK